MKKILSIITMLILAVTATMASMGQKDTPTIKFEKMTHDFGVIHESAGTVTCRFRFTNTGKAPLVIISATAACGCTQPSFDGQPIAPGASSVVTVSYIPKGRPGEFNKTITLRTNDPKHKKVTLKITGNVVK